MIKPLLVIIHDFPKFATGANVISKFAFVSKSISAKILSWFKFNTKVASFKIHDVGTRTTLKGKTTSQIAMLTDINTRVIMSGTGHSGVSSIANASSRSIIKANTDIDAISIKFNIDESSIKQYQVQQLKYWDDFTLEELNELMLSEMDGMVLSFIE